LVAPHASLAPGHVLDEMRIDLVGPAQPAPGDVDPGGLVEREPFEGGVRVDRGRDVHGKRVPTGDATRCRRGTFAWSVRVLRIVLTSAGDGVWNGPTTLGGRNASKYDHDPIGRRGRHGGGPHGHRCAGRPGRDRDAIDRAVLSARGPRRSLAGGGE